MRFNFKNSDVSKANSNIEREFKPLEGEDVTVYYKALSNGDVISIMSKGGNIDPIEIFKNQVTKIDGITFNFEDGEEIEATPEMIINAPVNTETSPLLRLITFTVNEIMGNSKVTEEEEKNSDSDIDVQEETY